MTKAQDRAAAYAWLHANLPEIMAYLQEAMKPQKQPTESKAAKP